MSIKQIKPELRATARPVHWIELTERAAWKRARALRLDLVGDMSMGSADSALEDAKALVRVLRDINTIREMRMRADMLRAIYGEADTPLDPPPDDIEF